MNSFENHKYIVNKHLLYELTIGGEGNVCGQEEKTKKILFTVIRIMKLYCTVPYNKLHLKLFITTGLTVW